MTSRWHWPVAFCAAASLHLAVAAVMPPSMPEMPGALAEGDGGLEVGLGYLGGFADRVETAPEEQTPEPEPVPEVAPEPEAVAEPTPVVEPDPEPLPVVAPIPAQVAVAPPPAPKPPPPKTEVKVATPKPAPTPTPEPEPEPARSETAKTVGPAQAAMLAGTGSGSERRSGGRRGGAPNYISELAAALKRHKTYPSALKKRKTQGTVMLAFAIDIRGDLLRAQVSQSSGHPELDAAALAMLQNAAPLPPIPKEFNRNELSLEIPVEYSLITD